jgi:RNA polymerase sigma-70 factor (ECF subfamily)
LSTNADARGPSIPHYQRTHHSPETAPSNGGSDPAEAELIRAAQRGHEAAIERLWTLNERSIHLHLSRYLRDPGDVAEAAQEVFIRMLNALPRYRFDGTPFHSWLSAIARNHAIDVLRREKYSRAEDDESLTRLLEAAGGEEGAEGWLADERTALAVSALPVDQQRMLLLRFGFGYKSDEVAELLGCSPDAVRQQQSRALRRLAASLQNGSDGRPPVAG